MSLPGASRRAKIVCTLGPATSSPTQILELVQAGMDVARLNLSHGTHESHAALCGLVREAADRAGRAVGVLADLQGPKIRLGRFQDGRAVLASGARFTITTRAQAGDSSRASADYEELPGEVKAGDPILLGDGIVQLEVLEVKGNEVRCRVVEGGDISDHQGINLPRASNRLPALTTKDRGDLAFVLGLGVDLVALSFVRRAQDAEELRRAMAEAGTTLPIIAKLEKPQAVSELDAILVAFDGLMVARGDLGVEMPLERVPLVQKRAIDRAREHRKPVIVATQMLESMVHHGRPTRAEASDVANAVLDGADALMLSAETSIGEHAALAVDTMARIITSAEEDAPARPPLTATSNQADAIAHAACRVAHELTARAIVAFTQSGETARRLAVYREPIPLLAFTPDPAVRRQLALVWGVETFVVPPALSTDEIGRQVDRALLELGRGRPGEVVVIVAGSPPGVPGTTNMLRAHRLGEPD